ncbi:MAG: membrane protein insertion efficiency factor YidD [bacterium]|nr:membrane protein insertion efficiency factor YidD [bacterium]
MLRKLSLNLIVLYQDKLSWRLKSSCRFVPTCSNYAYMAIEKNGFVIGVCLGVRRVLRCRSPYGGIDYPPARKNSRVRLGS